jgi:hypothetical protein
MHAAHVAHPLVLALLRSPAHARSAGEARGRESDAYCAPARALRPAARSTGPWRPCAAGGHAGCTTGRPTPATAQAALLEGMRLASLGRDHDGRDHTAFRHHVEQSRGSWWPHRCHGGGRIAVMPGRGGSGGRACGMARRAAGSL